MRSLFLSFCLLTSVAAYSQSYSDYFSLLGQITSKEESYFRRDVTKEGDKWIVKEFYSKDGSRKLEAECSEVKPNLVYHGPVKSYEEGGNIYAEEKCIKGKCKYVQYWQDAKPVLVKGTGVFNGVRQNADPYTIEFRDSTMFASYSVEATTSDTVYVIVPKPAEFPGGMASFYKKLQSKLDYPKEARKKRDQGRVFVEFIVDKTGVVRSVKSIKGVSYELDNEAVTKLPLCGNWIPGTVDGKPVKQRFVLPVTFKL